ncbi:NAD(P)-binding domain-containing protein [Siminovitchia sediminis]|uniref:NAD(P)-binding domain-containing protein n=1 Tax=Siminovitchia sediminis TaxID=1274353 RepID=A0ABW4KDC8_9BACI
MLDLAIIGAGPYGLSIAAHAKEAGLNYKVFGYPMDFWKTKMPPEMFIRTQLDYTGLSDPHNQFTLRAYEKEKNTTLNYPIPRSIFVDYGLWFAEKTNILIDPVLVKNITQKDNFFQLKTENDSVEQAKHVVVAVGVTNSKYIPPNLASLPADLVSHTSDHTEFNRFQNQHVIVLGGGQSAWEAAALLHKAGAVTELVYRRPYRLPPIEGINANQREIADKFYFYPDEKKKEIRNWLELPTVSDFLVPLVEGKVKQRPSTSIKEARARDDGRLDVTYSDGMTTIADHIIAATGYRFTPGNLDFLTDLLKDIQLNEAGEPQVNEFFESTVTNLFFAGPAAGFHHGPAFRVMAGVWRTSEVLIDYVERGKNKVFQ